MTRFVVIAPSLAINAQIEAFNAHTLRLSQLARSASVTLLPLNNCKLGQVLTTMMGF